MPPHRAEAGTETPSPKRGRRLPAEPSWAESAPPFLQREGGWGVRSDRSQEAPCRSSYSSSACRTPKRPRACSASTTRASISCPRARCPAHQHLRRERAGGGAAAQRPARRQRHTAQPERRGRERVDAGDARDRRRRAVLVQDRRWPAAIASPPRPCWPPRSARWATTTSILCGRQASDTDGGIAARAGRASRPGPARRWCARSS